MAKKKAAKRAAKPAKRGACRTAVAFDVFSRLLVERNIRFRLDNDPTDVNRARVDAVAEVAQVARELAEALREGR